MFLIEKKPRPPAEPTAGGTVWDYRTLRDSETWALPPPPAHARLHVDTQFSNARERKATGVRPNL